MKPLLQEPSQTPDLQISRERNELIKTITDKAFSFVAIWIGVVLTLFLIFGIFFFNTWNSMDRERQARREESAKAFAEAEKAMEQSFKDLKETFEDKRVKHQEVTKNFEERHKDFSERFDRTWNKLQEDFHKDSKVPENSKNKALMNKPAQESPQG